MACFSRQMGGKKNIVDVGTKTLREQRCGADVKPSRTIGMWNAAAPRITPVMAPISSPPTFVRTSRGSFGSGRFNSRPRSMAPTFLLRSDRRFPCLSRQHPGAQRPSSTKYGCGAAGVADPHLAGAEEKEVL